MTDTIIDDDIIETMKSTKSASNSTTRRPMFIETEVRTDTISKRRAGSTTTSRSVQDILANTRSPTDGLPQTTYTYAHSVSYMPVTQSGSYDVPVMARRDLHGDYRHGSTSFSSSSGFMSNVRSQLTNGYSAIRDRLTHQNNHEQEQTSNSLSNSSFSQGGQRDTRSSSQSSTSVQGGRSKSGGHAPIHSTPRDTSSKQKYGKNEDEEDQQHYYDGESDEYKGNFFVRLIKRILHSPIDLLSFIWHKFFGLPWWLLLPLLLFLGFYAFPHLACKPLEHYPESKLYQNCRAFQVYAENVTNSSVQFLREQTFNRGGRIVSRSYHYLIDLKDKFFNLLDDIFYNVRKDVVRKVDEGKEHIVDVKDDVKEYCESRLHQAKSLIDDFKTSASKYLGTGPVLEPIQEKELEVLIRHLLDEYAADETGKADYALEANGGKIVDTKCTEYTDEPRQNVVKFLGIPIVHMSKQPNIMIKAGRMPGQCFPFKGDQGSVVIKLAIPVKPKEFVLEHLSKNLSIVGHINSAPNNFTVYALKDKHDKEGIVLGRYFYDAEHGPSLQRFKPQRVNVPLVEYIEIRITSNWGNPNYTCLYRFRVHGDLQSTQPSAPPAA